MITLQSAAYIILLITLVIAYCLSVPVAGAFRAWFAHKMGDDTAKNMGFLTLNPLVHVDFLGVFFLLVFQCGWGRYVPINPYNMEGPLRWLRLICAYFSDIFAYFCMATLVLFSLICFFGKQIVFLIIPMVRGSILSHLLVAQHLPGVSSTTVTLVFIGITIIYLNVILAVLNFVMSSFWLLAIFLFERYPQYWAVREFLFFIVPMLVILFFSYYLRMLVLSAVSVMGFLLATIVNFL